MDCSFRNLEKAGEGLRLPLYCTCGVVGFGGRIAALGMAKMVDPEKPIKPL
jgi:hypothetical protein